MNGLEPTEATLCYYDNEKKFRTNMESNSSLCKGKILIRDCFAIQRKSDQKNKNIIAIYTPSELLSCVCDDENDASEWIEFLNQILHHCPEYLDRQLRDFGKCFQNQTFSKTLGSMFFFSIFQNISGRLQFRKAMATPKT